jgi:hypothetical protein
MAHSGALNDDILTGNRRIGYVYRIRDDGCGYIYLCDGSADSIFAHANQLFKPDYQACVGDIVDFNLFLGQNNRLQAQHITRIGWERPQERLDLLLAVARLGNPREWLAKLAVLADQEIWSLSFDQDSPRKEILLNYIRHTFVRLCETGGVCFFKHHGENHMAFNTGLYSRSDKHRGSFLYIYAVFFESNTSHDAQNWQLCEFTTSECFADKYNVPKNLVTADYEQYNFPHFNPEKQIDIDAAISHILDERSHRLPDEVRRCERREDQEAILTDAIELAQSTARQNFAIAVLHYYRFQGRDGELQWLLPFRLQGIPDAKTYAMPLKDCEDKYMVKTLLPLPTAYMNARLLRRVEPSEWLRSSFAP